MSKQEMNEGLGDFWKEFRKEKTALGGLGILVFYLLLILFEPLILPFQETGENWRNISYWEDFPTAAPPVWTNLFRSEKKALNEVFELEEANQEIKGDSQVYTFSYDYQYHRAPKDLILRTQIKGDFFLRLKVLRPDGKELILNEASYLDFTTGALRFSLYNDAKDRVFRFLREEESRSNLRRLSPTSIDPMTVLFATAQKGMTLDPKPLQGEYSLSLEVGPRGKGFELEGGRFIVSGQVSGLLGTDIMKRDIFSGILVGLKWALLIGFLTSLAAVLIGVSYGVVSAYFGGTVDAVMQFIFQIFVGVPILPVLIVVSAIFKPSIWTLIGMMVLFFWTSSVMTVRSIAMQIREESFVEAASALGASHRRIIFRHMFPILVPYSFAMMALNVPSSIVYESTVSLLGLGDASIVTWGQILQGAAAGGAILNGYWWWVIPPGVLIAITGMSFALVGYAMDRILNPKMKLR